MRHDFLQKTIDTLAKRVGTRCSNPACRKLTTGPGSDPSHVVNIGAAAHITGASPGGPRYDPDLTPGQRRAAENGIWLCQNCAKLIDSDATRFNKALLQKWKDRAEAEVYSSIEGRGAPATIETWSPADIELLYRKIRITSQRHDYLFVITLANRGNERLGRFHVDFECPSLIIEQPERRPYYIPDRSSRTRCFFRVTDEIIKDGLFPDDEKEILTVPYYVDNEIYMGRVFGKNRILEEIVYVSFYVEKCFPITIERPFEEFQIF